MTKSQLADIVAKKGHLPKKAATEAIEVFLDEVRVKVSVLPKRNS